MTGEIVNLRRVRKSRDRAAREADAAANRVIHGRTKAERVAVATEATRSERLLDGHRLASKDDGTGA